MIFHTDEEAQAACAEWQRILRLQDWDVKVHVLSGDHQDENGLCKQWPKTREALITLMDAASFPGRNYTSFPHDMEALLVHELLHIPFAPMRPKEKDTMAFEHWEATIDTLARSFVALKRSANN